ncbi:MAG: heme exporter protein CcmB [Bacillota bacterium]
MNSYWKNIWLIYKKDIKMEIRSLDNIISTVIFSMILIFIISLSFQFSRINNSIYPGLIWVILYFAASFSMIQVFSREQNNKVMDGLILAVRDKSCIFLAKTLVNLTFLLFIELIVIPLFFIMTDYKGQVSYILFIYTLIMGSLGLSLISTFLNTIIIQLKGTKLLLPVLLFPLSVPLLITVIECSKGALMSSYSLSCVWIYFLIIYNLVFLVLSLILFDFLLE